MEVYRISSRLFLLLGIFCLVTTLQGVQGGVESEGPSESECRPYIEKALKELETAEAAEPIAPGDSGGESKEEEEGTEEVIEEVSTVEITTDDSDHTESDGDNDIEAEESKESTESAEIDEAKEEADDDHSEEEMAGETSSESQKITSAEGETEEAAEEEQSAEEHEEETKEHEESDESPQSAEIEEAAASAEEHSVEEKEEEEEENGSDDTDDKRESAEDKAEAVDETESAEDDKSTETNQASVETVDDDEGTKSEEDKEEPQGDEPQSQEDRTESTEAGTESTEDIEQKSAEDEAEPAERTEQKSAEEDTESAETTEQESAETTEQESAEAADHVSAETTEQESAEEPADAESATAGEDTSSEDDKSVDDEVDATASAEEEQSVEDAGADIVHEGDADETEDNDSKEAVGYEEAVGESRSEEENKSGEANDSDGSEDRNIREDDSDDQVPKDAEASEETVSETDDVKESEKEEQPQGDEAESQEEIKGGAESNADDGDAGLEEMAGQDEGATEEEAQEQNEEEENKSKEITPEEELINEGEIPENLRPIDHIWQLLKLDDDNLASEKIINGVAEITLRDLKKLYENAIKPLETLYKYRDLSNRHFGDAEIFSKPLVLFMGPWSGGKSSIINYLLNNEYNETSLRTGAEPSPAYFNILMYGEEPEVVDGTQLAADFTFSGLQKFGQGLEERLRGLKLPQKLLQKINIVEIPGILEVRKQISRVFPFNDACQWFIDRADIIFLVYDPSKLDVGPETEAILDQLKGREPQTRIILNKADQVKPEELMRVQGALIWNISPLMSSAQPPVMYTTSLWSKPYEIGAPIRLLQAQERAFLRDLRSSIDKRIENKIASARRFAVRVRNHAKMVDCYLTTYYNHKSVFGNRKQVSDAIIEHPQDYHIYEGLSTLTNISRYDLPDPDVYRDFFRLNPLYDFQQLSATCTYFRGCPINRLDVAIAYDLPELVGKHKRMIESALTQANLAQTPGS